MTTDTITLAGEVRRIFAKPTITRDKPLAALMIGLLVLRGGESTVGEIQQDVQQWEAEHGPATRPRVLRWAEKHEKANEPVPA